MIMLDSKDPGEAGSYAPPEVPATNTVMDQTKESDLPF